MKIPHNLSIFLSFCLLSLFSTSSNAQNNNNNNAPTFLGAPNPNDALSSSTPNNPGVQATQLTPMLATPFINLNTPAEDTTPKNGIPNNIAKLLKAKNFKLALAEIDDYLKKNPKNIQLRFIRSRILIEQGQLEQARTTLVELTEKFPELPEPYNNLAVLYASLGKLDLARDNLEMSLKLAPENAVALQNLGDIYTRLAASHYAHAYRLNRRMQEADHKRKLAEAITQKK